MKNIIDNVLDESHWIDKKAETEMTKGEWEKYKKEHPKTKMKPKIRDVKEKKPDLKKEIQEKKKELSGPKSFDKDIVQSASDNRVFDFKQDEDSSTWTLHNDDYPDEPMEAELIHDDGTLILQVGSSTREYNKKIKTKKDLEEVLSNWDDHESYEDI